MTLLKLLIRKNQQFQPFQQYQQVLTILQENPYTLGILPLKVIVPITDWKARHAAADWMVQLIPNNMNNLHKNSAADCFQVRSLSKKRMVRKIGYVETSKMQEIEDALARVLKIK